MKVAVEGCCHGELDVIYEQIQRLESKHDYKVDLLLICGDFQAVRNWRDLECMAVPDKYKALQTFYKYYTGEKVAPILTIVIGGNHEASNYMTELFHGGWLAPNIYYLGVAGCVQVNGIRIAGASGIFKQQDFRLGFYERLPYDKGSMRSIYHLRESTVRRLSLLSSPSLFLSHDWPNTIERHGDTEDLLRKKRFFTQEVRNGTLGSPPMMGLLQNLKPDWWFSAHMHVRFEATYVHEYGPAGNPDEIQLDADFDVPIGPGGTTLGSISAMEEASKNNPDEILLEDEEEAVEPPPPPPPPRKETRFLALDKCIRNRQFLEVVDIPTPAPLNAEVSQSTSVKLSFDKEWLAITRAFHPWLSMQRFQRPYPEEAEARALVAAELDWVKKNIPCDASGDIPVSEHLTFVITAPGPGSEGALRKQQPPWYPNPQTAAFCRMLGIENKVDPSGA